MFKINIMKYKLIQ